MRSVLVISKSWLDRDPRVYKQILFLKEAGFRVTSVGLGPSRIEDGFLSIPRSGITKTTLGRVRSAVQLKLRRYEEHYWSEAWIRKTHRNLSEVSGHFDLVVANDVPALPLARRIAQSHGAKLYLDAHEYEPRHYDNLLFNFFFRDYWDWICRRYLPTVDHMTTVCQGIADEYSNNFHVQCDVMMNLPFYEGLVPENGNDGRIKMIHHGVAVRRRRIENMIKLMRCLDSRFQLDLMLIGMDSPYGRYLRRLAGKDERIRFRPSVGMRDIARTISGYDLGLYLLPPDSFNQRMALPNKIFEYVQGRLSLAIWPSQEMVRVVDRYQNGVYSKDFDIAQIATVLNRLSYHDILRMKRNSHAAAQELNAGQTRKQLLAIVDSLLG